MKKLLIPLFIALTASAFVFASSASAAEGKSMTPQQQKFANCAHESKGMKSVEHKKFMSDCLAGKTHEMQAGAAHEGMAASSAMKSEKSKTHATTSKMMTSRDDSVASLVTAGTVPASRPLALATSIPFAAARPAFVGLSEDA